MIQLTKSIYEEKNLEFHASNVYPSRIAMFWCESVYLSFSISNFIFRYLYSRIISVSIIISSYSLCVLPPSLPALRPLPACTPSERAGWIREDWSRSCVKCWKYCRRLMATKLLIFFKIKMLEFGFNLLSHKFRVYAINSTVCIETCQTSRAPKLLQCSEGFELDLMIMIISMIITIITTIYLSHSPPSN